MPIIEIPDKPEDAEKIEKTLKTMDQLGKTDNFVTTIRRDRVCNAILEAKSQSDYALECGDEIISNMYIEIRNHYIEIATLLNNRLPVKLQRQITK